MALRNGHSMTAAAMLIAVLSFASRLLGLVRDRVLAGTFGAGDILDAYYAAFRIPDFAFNIIGLAALSAAFLPVFVRLREQETERAWRFAASLLSDVAVALAIACGIGFVAAAPLFRTLAPGFSDPQLALTITLGRILFLATFLLGCSSVLGGVLQAQRRFLAFAAAPLCYNLGIIIGALTFVPIIGPIGLAWGVVLGSAGHLAVQAVAARRVGFRFRWVPSWRDAEIRATVRLLLPRMMGLATQQVQLIVIAGIASTLAHGSLAVFTFATNIQAVPIALFGVAYAIAAFPSLSEAVAARSREAFRSHLSMTIRQIALFALPSVVLLVSLKAQIVRVLLGTGAFGWADTIRTLETLEAFGYGLVFAMLLPLCTRAFYAHEDTWTPFAIGIVSDVVGIVTAWVLGKELGPRGLALGISVAMVLQATLLLAALRLRVGPIDGRRIALSGGRFVLAAVAMGGVIQGVKPIIAAWIGTDTFLGIGLQGVAAAGLGFATYLVIGVLLRSEEITALARALHGHVLRVARLPLGGADEARG